MTSLEASIRTSFPKLALRSLKAVGKVSLKAVPQRIRKNIDDRFFYAIFNLTRVTNDHYPERDDAPESEQE